MDKALIKVKEVIKPLGDFSGEYPDSVVEYFKFYGLDFDSENVEHVFGTFESGGLTLAGHIYKPKEYKAAVFILHGYFDHCGQLNFLVKHLLEAGYAVAAFDLPGHGLSAGQPAAIDDFSQYSQALTDFANTAGPRLNRPYHLIGHSTGAAAVLDYLLTNKDCIFDKVILAAPLVHCSFWEQSKIGYKKKVPFIKSVPRMFRKNSSDAEFMDFVRTKDPLQSRMLPLSWVRALHRWNDKIVDLPPCDKPVKIIQGTKDTTVDWKFNIKFLQDKFSNAKVSLIEDGRHELFNESTDIRKKVFSLITDCLEN